MQGHAIGSMGVKINPYTGEARLSENRGSAYSFKNENVTKQKSSGITAIDLYYQAIDFVNEAESLRYSTEFRRIVE